MDQPSSSMNVQHVGVRQLFPVQLLVAIAKVTVKGGILVRIVAITQLTVERQTDIKGLLSQLALIQEAADRRIIAGGSQKHLAGQSLPSRQRGVPFMFCHFLQDHRIVGGIANHRHPLVVLGRRPQHGWTTDIDVFDRLLQRHILFGHRLLKGIQIDRDKINDRDLMFGRVSLVLIMVPTLKQSTVDFRVQRLDPPVKQLGKARVITHIPYFDPVVRQMFGRATGGENLHPPRFQSPSKVEKAGLVGNG